MLNAESPPPAPSPSYAARRAVHRRRVRLATPPAALAQWPRDRGRRLLLAPTPAIRAASRLPERGALRAAHRPGMRTDSHSEFRGRTVTARACPRPGNESVLARFRATPRRGLRYPAPR